MEAVAIAPQVMVWLLGLLLGLLAMLLWKTIGSAGNALDWADLVTETGNRHVSLEKVLLIVIACIGSWAVITLAYSGKLSWEIFAAYLALGGGSKGYSTYLAARWGNGNSSPQDRNGDREERDRSLDGGRRGDR